METSKEEVKEMTPIKTQPDVLEKTISPIKIKLTQRKSQVEAFPIDACPTFRPTIEEFTNKTFSELLIEYEAQCGDSGIFKVRFQPLNVYR